MSQFKPHWRAAAIVIMAFLVFALAGLIGGPAFSVDVDAIRALTAT